MTDSQVYVGVITYEDDPIELTGAYRNKEDCREAILDSLEYKGGISDNEDHGSVLVEKSCHSPNTHALM